MSESACNLEERPSTPRSASAPTKETPSLNFDIEESPKKEDQVTLAPSLTDQSNFLPKKQLLLAFVGLSAALACSFLDQTIVATALPKIASDLHSGRESSWVATAYLLTSLAFTPLYGRFSDIFGRKAVLISALILFWIFSMACALSQTMLQLIIFRALKGIGGGAIATTVIIIIADVVTLKERPLYQGFTEVISAFSNGLGPIIGGLFSQYATWCFWINLPLCGFALAAIIWLIPLKRVPGAIKGKLLKVDYVGSGLTILGSVTILLGLTWGGVQYPWSSVAVLLPLISGIVIMALFLLWEAKMALLPIVPIRIFRNPTVIGTNIATSVGFMTHFVTLYYVPQLLQLLRDTSAVKAGVFMLPYMLVIPVNVTIHGLIVSRTGKYRPSIIAGFALWTVAQGLMTTIDEKSSNSKIMGVLAIAALGAGGTFQTSLIATHAAVPRQEMAVVTGVRNFLRLLASAIALALGASIVNNTLRTSLNGLSLSSSQIQTVLDDPTSINNPTKSGLSLASEQKDVVLKAYASGFQKVFYMTVGLCALGTIASAALIKQFSLEREGDAEIKASVEENLRAKRTAREKDNTEAAVEVNNVERS